MGEAHIPIKELIREKQIQEKITPLNEDCEVYTPNAAKKQGSETAREEYGFLLPTPKKLNKANYHYGDCFLHMLNP